MQISQFLTETVFFLKFNLTVTGNFHSLLLPKAELTAFQSIPYFFNCFSGFHTSIFYFLHILLLHKSTCTFLLVCCVTHLHTFGSNRVTNHLPTQQIVSMNVLLGVFILLILRSILYNHYLCQVTVMIYYLYINVIKACTCI